MRDGWAETTLDGIAEYINGYPFKPADLGEVGLPVIRIKQLLDPNEPVDRTNTDTPDRCLLRDGDIVFSWSGTLAVRIWNRGPAKLNQHLFRVVEKKGVYKGIIPLILEHAIEELEEKSHGTTMKHITKQTLLPHKVLLPPLPEQKRIVDLISSVDSYIEALQQQLESAKRSRNAVLHELLTAGSDDWVETTLGQEFEICKNGKNYKDGISTEGLPISRIQTIASGKIDLTKVGFGNLFLEDAEGFLLEEGDILFSHINSLPHVGKVAIVQPNHLPLIHGMNLLRMRFTDSNDTKFMFYLMQNESMRDEIKSRAQVAVNQVSINISNIKTIRIVIPPLRTQREIASLIDAWENLIEECENNLNSSRNLRVGLLSQLLGGEHEIPASYDKVIGAA